MNQHKNRYLHGTVLTHTAPSANQRNEGFANHSTLQSITGVDNNSYIINSTAAIKSALRDAWKEAGLPVNRTRIDFDAQNQELQVVYEEFPNPDKYPEDMINGYCACLGEQDLKKVQKATKQTVKTKRTSILRINIAVALRPFQNDQLMMQAPRTFFTVGDQRISPSTSSALVQQEVSYTDFQFPFSTNLTDWDLDNKLFASFFKATMESLVKLHNVGGNHSRSYYPYDAASVVLRLSNSPVPQYESYGFVPNQNNPKDVGFPEVVEGILARDYDGHEFYLGGNLVKNMPPEIAAALQAKGANLFRTAEQAMNKAVTAICGQGFITNPNINTDAIVITAEKTAVAAAKPQEDKKAKVVAG